MNVCTPYHEAVLSLVPRYKELIKLYAPNSKWLAMSIEVLEVDCEEGANVCNIARRLGSIYGALATIEGFPKVRELNYANKLLDPLENDWKNIYGRS